MKNFRCFSVITDHPYKSYIGKTTITLIEAEDFKAALTSLNALLRTSVAKYEIKAIIENSFDNSLFNL